MACAPPPHPAAATSPRRSLLPLQADGGFAAETQHEKVRHNVAKLNIFADDIKTTHPKVASASPTICELNEGEALFLPKGWHHAVISVAPERRNIAVNTWYDLQGAGKSVPLSRVSSLDELFQQEGCAAGGRKT